MSLPSLADLEAHPELIDQLTPTQLNAVMVQVSGVMGRLAMRAATVPRETPDEETGDAHAASRIIGIAAATLRKRAKYDPAIMALTIDTGTDRIVFDLGACRRFRDQRRGTAVVPMLPRRVRGRVGRPSPRQPGRPSPDPA